MKRYIISYVVLCTVFVSMLLISSSIPSYFGSQNLDSTLRLFENEGIYPSFGFNGRKIGLDNFSEALMVNTALSIDSRTPLKSALTNMRAVDTRDKLNQISALKMVIRDKETAKTGYERYWHGYLIYLRPLLMIMPYSQIRMLLALSLYSIFISFIYLLWRRTNVITVIAFFVGFLFIDFFYLYNSMQFSGVFLIALVSAILRMTLLKKKKEVGLLFFIVGGITSFIDLLTAPLVTLGMLLLLETQLQKQSTRKTIIYSLLWGTGYLSLWATKWILVELLFTPGAIHTSWEQIINRTVTQADPEFNHFETIKRNVFQLIGYDKKSKIVMLLFGMILGVFCLRYIQILKSKIKELLPLVLICIMPYIWYLIAANHSYLHVWFTYRTQFMIVVGGLLIIKSLTNWGKVKHDFMKVPFLGGISAKLHIQ